MINTLLRWIIDKGFVGILLFGLVLIAGLFLIVLAVVGHGKFVLEVDMPMAARVLVGIIGVVVLAIGIGGLFVIVPGKLWPDQPGLWRLVAALAMLLMVSLLGNVFLLYFPTPTPPPTPTPVIGITYPVPFQTVSACETVSVDTLNVPPGQSLWVGVYGPDNKYYPQRPPDSVRKGDGKAADRWQVTACFGAPGRFDIWAVLANEEANLLLIKYVQEAIETGNWLGQRWLPKGTEELASRVPVLRGN